MGREIYLSSVSTGSCNVGLNLEVTILEKTNGDTWLCLLRTPYETALAVAKELGSPLRHNPSENAYECRLPATNILDALTTVTAHLAKLAEIDTPTLWYYERHDHTFEKEAVLYLRDTPDQLEVEVPGKKLKGRQLALRRLKLWWRLRRLPAVAGFTLSADVKRAVIVLAAAPTSTDNALTTYLQIARIFLA